MLLALLYQRDGGLAAAAPACDQQPLGSRYWRDVYPDAVDARDGETAYVDVTDETLVERLLNMEFRDGREAAAVVDDYLGV